MVRMPMRNQYSSNTATFCASSYDCLKISVIINRRIDNRGALLPFTKNNGVRAWPCHNRGIWGQDVCVCLLHQILPYISIRADYDLVICSGTSQALSTSS